MRGPETIRLMTSLAGLSKKGDCVSKTKVRPADEALAHLHAIDRDADIAGKAKIGEHVIVIDRHPVRNRLRPTTFGAPPVTSTGTVTPWAVDRRLALADGHRAAAAADENRDAAIGIGSSPSPDADRRQAAKSADNVSGW